MDSNAIAQGFLYVIMLVLSVTVHEFAHAFAASKLGDDLPERQGRLTLNPAAHADPIGTLALPILAAFTGWPLFGWGRPVETMPTSYTRRFSMRAGSAIVSFAGPFANLVLATICLAVYAVLRATGHAQWGSVEVEFLTQMSFLNLTLFILNLIPVPPLDGSKIAAWLFGYKADRVLDQMASFGPLFLLVAIYAGGSFIARMAHVAGSLLLTGFEVLLR